MHARSAEMGPIYLFSLINPWPLAIRIRIRHN
jgi:hypothetical protein